MTPQVSCFIDPWFMICSGEDGMGVMHAEAHGKSESVGRVRRARNERVALRKQRKLGRR